MRKILLIALALCLSLGPGLSLAAETADPFATPEGTIDHFVSALARGDFAQAVCATDYFLLHGEEGVALAREGADPFALSGVSPVPGEYGLYNQMILAEALGEWANKIWWFCMYFQGYPEWYPSGLGFEGKEEAGDFVEIIDAQALSSLGLIRADRFPNAAEEEDVLKYAALLEVDSELYLQGFALRQARGRWWITFLGMLSGDDEMVWGEGEPVYVEDEADYLEWLAEIEVE